jgi:hypothetical protein
LNQIEQALRDTGQVLSRSIILSSTAANCCQHV